MRTHLLSLTLAAACLCAASPAPAWAEESGKAALPNIDIQHLSATDPLITPPPLQIGEDGYPIIQGDFDSTAGCAFIDYYRNQLAEFVSLQRNIKIINHLVVYGADVYYYEINTDYSKIQFEISRNKLFINNFDINGTLITEHMKNRYDLISGMKFKYSNLTRYDFMCEEDAASIFLNDQNIIRIRVHNYFVG